MIGRRCGFSSRTKNVYSLYWKLQLQPVSSKRAQCSLQAEKTPRLGHSAAAAEARVPVEDLAGLREIGLGLILEVDGSGVLEAVHVGFALVDHQLARSEQVMPRHLPAELFEGEVDAVRQPLHERVGGEVILKAVEPLDARFVDASRPADGVGRAYLARVPRDSRAEDRGGADQVVGAVVRLPHAHADLRPEDRIGQAGLAVALNGERAQHDGRQVLDRALRHLDAATVVAVDRLESIDGVVHCRSDHFAISQRRADRLGHLAGIAGG
mmetsp:Transcript_26997/g.68327  ORF Transcript_26997/g.68327 Transcript_26997/m.68327 type:complete len:268 (-) Transcript_26997:575-1378(-)